MQPSLLWAQIVADTGAPAGQRPAIAEAANGVPLINIQTPSAAGVSRNAYSQFDVQQQGAILNNARTDAQTQLGGWVQANPWLAGNSARVILNEVNSVNPSLLHGYVEVAGSRAQVVIANPAGISCDGCGFINANRATLTTGTPIVTAGNVEGYRVQGGMITISGAGLDASRTDYADLIARAVQVNAGIWGQELSVVAGSSEMSANAGTRTKLAMSDGEPIFGIDVAQLGGMYAGKITLVGTGDGVGVRNAGSIGATIGKLIVTAEGRIENSGTLYAQDKLALTSQDNIDNTGNVGSQGDAHIIATNKLRNTQGLIASYGDILINAAEIDNNGGQLLSDKRLNIQSSELVNRNGGLMDAQQTYLDAVELSNVGDARIYGDHVAISAAALNNKALDGAAPVIGARERLDIGAETINNTGHALIFSAGSLHVGGALDESRQAIGRADTINNHSATIEALDDLTLAARQINNINENFSTGLADLGSEYIVEYQGSGSPNRYLSGTPGVSIYNDESDHLRTPEGSHESWLSYTYYRHVAETQVTVSDPARILAGGDMLINAEELLNDKSHIIAGGSLTGDITNLNNTEVAGERIFTDAGSVNSYWRHYQKGRDRTGSSTSTYRPAPVIQTISLAPTTYAQNAAVNGSGTQIGGATINDGNIGVPNSSLFRVIPSATYLIETDPRFLDHRSWLSSDYLLSVLSFDPASMQKRLGDGFYEQKLIREQVAQLTGRRYLDGYASDEAQYQALMEEGAIFAQAHQLRPGIALTAEQMAALTSDIVWLVEKQVTLPDGQKVTALVPQVYVRLQESDLSASGALITGNAVNLNLAGDLVNSGTIAGRNVLLLTAENVSNLGGRMKAADLNVAARKDFNNIGGVLSAEENLLATAGNDFNISSTTRTQSGPNGNRTNIDRVAGLYLTGSGGQLIAMAGNDLRLNAADISNGMTNSESVVAGSTILVAGNDLNLGTVAESSNHHIVWDANNYRKDSSRTEVGTTIQSQGDLKLSAGRDLNTRAATVISEQGALLATAGSNVSVSSGENHAGVDERHQHKSKGFLKSKTITTHDTLDQTISQGSNFSGNTATLIAGNDLTVRGSNVVSTASTKLLAQNNIAIESASHEIQEGHFRDEKKSGLMSSGFGITIGTRQMSADRQNLRTAADASTVGSIEGDVSIAAGKTYRQVGSDVLAPEGSIDISAQKVDILEARETSRTTHETRFRQSGLTLALTGAAITAVQTVQQMSEAIQDTKDSRMQMLAAANSGFAVKNAYDAIQAGQGTTINGKSGQISTGTDASGNAGSRDANAADQAGGINLSISIGSSQSKSNTTQTSDSATGSVVSAGKDVRIVASGAYQESDVTVQGSSIKAGNEAQLVAENELQLLAAKNAEEQHSTNKNSSASIGISIGTNGFGVTLSASAGRGNADGSDVTWTNTHVDAGKRLILQSGGDTTLKGAVASAEQVVANVGSNLIMESLQDTSVYDSKQRSMGGSLTIGAGVSGSINASKSTISSNYASVTEQSGIRAGDGGFQINVLGDADLKGAVISSTDKAVEDGLNSFTAASLAISDIQNQASYSGKSVGVNIGSSVSLDGNLAAGGTSAGLGKEGGKADSVTQSGISGIAGNTKVRTGDEESGIDRIFDAERVQKEISAQVTITQTFTENAHRAVNTYVETEKATLREKMRTASEEEKPLVQTQLDELLLQERVMNVLIGAVTGMGGSAVTKEALSAAADEMRHISIESSKRFAGVIDVHEGSETLLSNLPDDRSGGVRGDEIKLGGTRVDLDLLCGVDNARCKTTEDGMLALVDGKVQWNRDGANGLSLTQWLNESPDAEKMYGPTGGVQGWEGTLFGRSYTSGSWQDKLIEAFSGTHDVLGGQVTGLYDEQGNIKRGMSKTESAAYNAWSSVAILPSTPFAMSELLPPPVWNAISIFLGAAK